MQHVSGNGGVFCADNENSDSHSMFQEIFEANPAPMVVLNADATVAMANMAFGLLSGFSGNELVGSLLAERLPLVEVGLFGDQMLELAQVDMGIPQQHETLLFTKDKQQRFVLFSVSFLSSSKKTVVTFIDITDKKAAEQKLRSSEEHYRTMIEYVSDIVFSISPSGILTYVSANWKDVLGYNIDEIIGCSYESLIHPDDLPYIKEQLRDGFAIAKKCIGVEYRLKDMAGHWRWYLSNTSAVLDGTGNVSALVGIAHDITNRKNMEEVLAESEFFFKESQRAANIGSYKANFKEGCWESSEVLDHILGIGASYDRNIAPGWTSIIHPDDREHVLAYLKQEVIQKRQRFKKEYRIVRKSDKETRWVHGLGEIILDEKGEALALIGTIQDITDRKTAEQLSLDRQLKLNIALKLARLGSWELNLEENLFYFNDTFYAVFRTNTQEVGSSTMTPEDYAKRFVYAEDHAVVGNEIVRALTTTDIEYNRQIEHRMLYADGEMGYVAVRFAIVKDSKGQTIRLFGVNQDITSVRNAENALKENETRLLRLNAMKDKFFSIIAHDLKTPFAAIMGFSEILVDHLNARDYSNVEFYSGHILKSSQKAMELLSNLMEWSRAETGRLRFVPKEIGLVAIVNETVELLAAMAVNKQITVKLNIPKDLVVFADLHMLTTILRNLISNAIKFTYPNGEVVVSARIQAGEVLIMVVDDGKGISEKILSKLFRIDENITTRGTAKEEGTGLGLILCNEFVEKHKGSIWVKSAVGVGSEFYFTVPHRSLD